MRSNRVKLSHNLCKYELDKSDVIRAVNALRALRPLIEKFSECPSSESAAKAPLAIRWFSEDLLPDLLRFIEMKRSNYGK